MFDRVQNQNSMIEFVDIQKFDKNQNFRSQRNNFKSFPFFDVFFDKRNQILALVSVSVLMTNRTVYRAHLLIHQCCKFSLLINVEFIRDVSLSELVSVSFNLVFRYVLLNRLNSLKSPWKFYVFLEGRWNCFSVQRAATRKLLRPRKYLLLSVQKFGFCSKDKINYFMSQWFFSSLRLCEFMLKTSARPKLFSEMEIG